MQLAFLGKKMKLSVVTTVLAVKLFFLYVKGKALKKIWRSLVEGNCSTVKAPFQHARESQIHVLNPSLDCWESFPLLSTYQLNSPFFVPPTGTHFKTEILLLHVVALITETGPCVLARRKDDV